MINQTVSVVFLLGSLAFSMPVSQASLHEAVRKGDRNSVKIILQDDPKQLDALDNYRYTPLDWAATLAEWEILELLLEAGARVDNIGWDGGTVLHRACHYDHPSIIRILIQKGADLHRQNQWGRNALHVAARRGHVAVAALLLEHGLDMSVATREGWTSLHVAAKSGHPHMLEFLKQAGADEDRKDQEGKTASEYFKPRPPEIESDPATYHVYLGRYATPEGFEILIWERDDRLYVTDFGYDELYPIGPDEFYCRHEPWRVKFFRDEAGKVEKLDLSFLRRTLHCRKLD